LGSRGPKPDGRFVLEGLVGGNYRLATLLDPRPGAWLYPEFLRTLEPVSIPLRIEEGEKKTLKPLTARP
jgi:hypothetical protein